MRRSRSSDADRVGRGAQGNPGRRPVTAVPEEAVGDTRCQRGPPTGEGERGPQLGPTAGQRFAHRPKALRRRRSASNGSSGRPWPAPWVFHPARVVGAPVDTAPGRGQNPSPGSWADIVLHPPEEGSGSRAHRGDTGWSRVLQARRCRILRRSSAVGRFFPVTHRPPRRHAEYPMRQRCSLPTGRGGVRSSWASRARGYAPRDRNRWGNRSIRGDRCLKWTAA
jgi:hypothetical protein